MLNQILKHLKGKIDIVLVEGHIAPGEYQKYTDIITLDTRHSYIHEVLFHELAHATGHRNRLFRKTMIMPGFYNEEEVLAHLVSIKLSKFFKLPYNKCSEILSNWYDLETIKAKVELDVNKAYNFIVSQWLLDLTITKAA